MGGGTILHAGNTGNSVVDALPSYFEGLQSLGVPVPIVLMVSFLGLGGAKLGLHRYDKDLDMIENFPPFEPFLLPEVIIDDYGFSQDYARAVRPIFDRSLERGWLPTMHLLRQQWELAVATLNR